MNPNPTRSAKAKVPRAVKAWCIWHDAGDEKRDRLLLACKCREVAACRAADGGG